MSKHTPGPWKAVPNGGDDEDSRSLLVGKADQYGDFSMIADCRQKWLADELGGDEEANAHLIAAAPDLYAELSSLLDFLDGIVVQPNPELVARRKSGRIVLAKAEGRP